MSITTSYQAVFVGSAANDGTGDELRTAFNKVNNAFGYMGNTEINTVDLNASGTVTATDFSGNGSALNLSAYSGNLAVVKITNELEVDGNLLISNVYVPTLANSAGSRGQITHDDTYIYICIADNSWKRANLAAW
jgi:hypothetical protein